MDQSTAVEAANEYNRLKDLTLYALEHLLAYAKYLEDNNQLSYELLKQMVETYKGAK